MWRFFQPNRVAARSTSTTTTTSTRKDSPISCARNTNALTYNHAAAAAAVATSVAVVFMSSQPPLNNNKNQHHSNNQPTSIGSEKSRKQFKTATRIMRRDFSCKKVVTFKGKICENAINTSHEQKYNPQNFDNHVRCEASEQSSNNNSKIDGNNTASNITFRQRRLTLNTTGEKQGDEKNKSTDGDSKLHQKEKAQTEDASKKSPTGTNTMRVMYSTEFDQSEKSFSSIQAISYNDASNPPFPSHQVGTYSCHGVEPHPYIVYTKNDKPIDTNAISFFDRIFGTKSSENYSSAKVVTVSERKINQDRGHIIYPFANHNQTALFGVFDGHGELGEKLAEYTMNAVCQKLHTIYVSKNSSSLLSKKKVMRNDLQQVFRQIFQEIDDEVEKDEHLKSRHSGSTACVVLVRGNRVTVANVGDSRVVLARENSTDGKDLVAIDWSKDQNANDEVERERILKSGGFVTMPQEEGLPARVWLDEDCSQIGLAMSRSIGDHALKKVGVTSEPVVDEYSITDGDKFFIVASDGVWEFMSSTEAVAIIQKCFDNGMGASDACEILIKEAMEKWKEIEGDYRDDITAIVVRLKGLWDQDNNVN